MSHINPELASLQAVLTGRVQGVSFRVFVHMHASRLGLTGYVRNLRQSGGLEVRAEGKQTQLEELLVYLNRGPAGARVDGMELRWGEYTGDYPGFEIRY